MIELLKFATESPTNYVCTLVMLIGLAGLFAGVVNTILKQLTTSIVGIIIAVKANIETTIKSEE